MKDSQFNDWKNFHCSLFEQARMELADKPRALEEWREALVKVSYEDAMKASRMMLADLKLQPRFASQHPGKINELTLAMWKERQMNKKPTYVDGEQVYDCALCLDSGFVSVLDPRWVHGVQLGKIEIVREEGVNVVWSKSLCQRVSFACTCELGQVKKHIGRFDPQRHYRGLPPTHEQWLGPFVDWLEQHPLSPAQKEF
jgi:hypothetical protein